MERPRTPSHPGGIHQHIWLGPTRSPGQKPYQKDAVPPPEQQPIRVGQWVGGLAFHQSEGVICPEGGARGETKGVLNHSQMGYREDGTPKVTQRRSCQGFIIRWKYKA